MGFWRPQASKEHVALGSWLCVVLDKGQALIFSKHSKYKGKTKAETTIELEVSSNHEPRNTRNVVLNKGQALIFFKHSKNKGKTRAETTVELRTNSNHNHKSRNMRERL